MNKLRSLLNLERGEELPLLFLCLYLALALASYIIIKAARDGLFLHQFSAKALPYVYIAVAIVGGLAVSAYLRLSRHVGLTTLITRTLIFFIANVLVLWWVARLRWQPLAAVFYVWSSIFGVTVPTQVWTVANRILDVRQAKRLFPLISGGGILGSVAGGLVAGAMVKRVGTNHLLLVLVPLLALCVLLARRLLRRHAYEKSGIQPAVSVSAKKRGIESFWKLFAQDGEKPSLARYLRLIAILLALSAIVTAVIDFQFKFVVQRSITSRDELTAFFAHFYAFLNFLALVLQLVAGSRLTNKFGLRVTLFILPTALCAGTGLLLAYPLRLWAAMFLKGNDQTLRYSIDKSTVELLYLPVPQSLKADVKAVIDMMVQRFADGIGGVLLLVMTRVLGLGVSGVGWCNLALITIWLWVAFRARMEYVSAVRTNISDPDNLPPSVWKLVFSNPGSIALLDGVRKGSSFVEGADSIRQACSIAFPTQPTAALQKYLRDRDLKVRLSALLCLVRQGTDSHTLRKELSVIAADIEGTPEQWKDVAKALGEIHHPATVEMHTRLLAHPTPEVRKEAAISAGRAGRRELVPFLVRLLVDPEVAHEARQALGAYGSRILGTLADVMKDPGEDLEIRRSIPRVLAHVPNQASVDTLLEGMFDGDAQLADRSIRAASRLRLKDASLRFDGERIAVRIRDECEKTFWYQGALTCLYPDGQCPDSLARLLKDKTDRGKDTVFRLLALILPPTVVLPSWLALSRQDRLKKANVAEYLDNVLPAGLRERVLPLVEAQAGAPGELQDRHEILEMLRKGSEPELRECAEGAIAREEPSPVSSEKAAGAE
jgi:ATP:ADP antiporter, AAA family